MKLLCPKNWDDYELIDCGGFEKLERFGKYITIRPEPQALWDRSLSQAEWTKAAHVKFVQKTSSSGTWTKLREAPDRWKLPYLLKAEKQSKEIIFRLGLTAFKHVGVFPEQAPNWDFIYDSITSLKNEKPKFLNLFAYTGGASLAAKAAGADVIHVDSVKQVISWARENMENSGLSDIRWVVEDALRFVQREVKRGNKYHGIILDPPAYGIGASGEKWKLEDHLNEMMKLVFQLLSEKSFLILNAYSLGLSALIVENLFLEKTDGKVETGELYIHSSNGHKLPLGVFGRYSSIPQ